MISAYDFETGFKFCRLMDKINIEYKQVQFDNPSNSLYYIFIKKYQL